MFPRSLRKIIGPHDGGGWAGRPTGLDLFPSLGMGQLVWLDAVERGNDSHRHIHLAELLSDDQFRCRDPGRCNSGSGRTSN